MRLIYRPDGQPEQAWPVNLGRFRVAECEAIERRTGLPYGTEYKTALLKGATAPRRALLWTLLRRDHHTLRFEDVDFYDDELQLVFDVDELREMRDATAEAPGIGESERGQALAALDAEIDAALAAAGDDVDQVDGGGKAPSETSPTATG
ncbi:hypothetical protein [Micromonospora sp. RTGN7]|uniref:hypothetical protein n=1 Tax=Micromonospora sp. RTGN7 TaxID=3016526 RepID=UPI0029FEDD77|nr:hypothetical protein [Micromonospora sp. RTGN7]